MFVFNLNSFFWKIFINTEHLKKLFCRKWNQQILWVQQTNPISWLAPEPFPFRFDKTSSFAFHTFFAWLIQWVPHNGIRVNCISRLLESYFIGPICYIWKQRVNGIIRLMWLMESDMVWPRVIPWGANSCTNIKLILIVIKNPILNHCLLVW